MDKKCCDTCKYYSWYYDFCEKWECEMDARSKCDSYKKRSNAGVAQW